MLVDLRTYLLPSPQSILSPPLTVRKIGIINNEDVSKFWGERGHVFPC